MIHGDAIVSTQLSLNKFDKMFLILINMLIDFFTQITMIVPSFSYMQKKSIR